MSPKKNNQADTYTYGTGVFRMSNKLKLDTKEGSFALHLLMKESWAISVYNFSKPQLKQFHQTLAEMLSSAAINIHFFIFSVNRPGSLLKTISHIQFTHLRKLSINKCSIENIEVLQVIRAQKLQGLILDQNKIMSLRSFRKTHFKSLDEFRFPINPILEIPQISCVYFCKRLKVLCMDLSNQKELICEDIRPIVKIQSQVIDFLNADLFNGEGIDSTNNKKVTMTNAMYNLSNRYRNYKLAQ